MADQAVWVKRVMIGEALRASISSRMKNCSNCGILASHRGAFGINLVQTIRHLGGTVQRAFV